MNDVEGHAIFPSSQPTVQPTGMRSGWEGEQRPKRHLEEDANVKIVQSTIVNVDVVVLQ